MELWKEFADWPGYFVSSLGRVRGRRNNIIRGSRDKDGYAIIALGTRTPKVRTLKIHRLVIEAFVGEIPAGMQINHLNGIKDDNRLENLAIVTPSENVQHSFDVLGRKAHNTNPVKGEKHYHARFTEVDVRKMRDLAKSGMTQAKIAEQFDTAQTVVARIIRREAWAHVK